MLITFIAFYVLIFIFIVGLYIWLMPKFTKVGEKAITHTEKSLRDSLAKTSDEKGKGENIDV